MWSRRTDGASLGPATALAAALLALAGCGGRDAWLHEPLPERPAVQPPGPVAADAPRVRLVTSVGELVVALYPEYAPITVENFLRYVDQGFYEGTIIHRVERGPATLAVLQGGGYDADLQRKPTREPIPLESDNGLSNLRGTIAMARTSEPDSATSQFFLNYLDNPALDYAGPERPGYAVFGVAVEGIETVDRISMVPTHALPGTPFQVAPMVDVVIESARRDGRR